MFLKALNEEQKKSMLDLAFYVATIDGEYSEVEKALLEEYQYEMQCFYKPSKKPLSEILSVFVESSEFIRRIVLIELCGLVTADNISHKEEDDFINQITAEFGSDQRVAEQAREYIYELNQCLVKIKVFINSKKYNS